MRGIKVGMAVAAAAITMWTTVAQADVLIEVDLTTPDTIVVSATTGLSAIDASGSNFTGFLLADFYNGGTETPSTASDFGDLTSFENPSDGTPSIFRGSGTPADSGLNFWSFSTDATVTFTAGSQAFTGSATWSLDPLVYADMVAGNLSGDLLFPADTSDDPGLTLGTWIVVPEPSSIAILSLGAIGLIRRRR